MYPLTCHLQHYAWGKPARESVVAQMNASSTDQEIKDPMQPCAELWMGTHPNGPSIVHDAESNIHQPLSEWLTSRPAAMGAAAIFDGGSNGNLPFLFKVLSINKALSIQAHPDKSLAEKLHSERPDVYKDNNHKPEMSCALTDFEALCGFRRADKIVELIAATPEFQVLVGAAEFEAFRLSLTTEDPTDSVIKSSLRAMFKHYMTSDEDTVKHAISDFIKRVQNTEDTIENTDLRNAYKIILRLSQEFPGDIGIFAPLLLNYLRLSPGQAFFMAANEPHAYLKGDCIECMACSDNVVRAGLTPKLRDVNTLCDMLTYNTGTPGLVQPTQIDEYTKEFRPSVPEFLVQQTDLPPSASVTRANAPSASIVLISKGNGFAKVIIGGGNVESAPKPALQEHQLKLGQAFIVAADADVQIEAGSEGITFFRVHVNA